MSVELPMETTCTLQVRGNGGIEARDMSALAVDRRVRVGHVRGSGPVCMRCGCNVEERFDACPTCGATLLWAGEELDALRGRLDGYGDEDAVLDWGVDLADSMRRDFDGGAAVACVFAMRDGSMRDVPPTMVPGGAMGTNILPALPFLATERVASLGHSEYAVYDMRDAASVEAVRRAMRGRLAAFDRECDVERADAQRSLLEAFSAASREGVGDDGGSAR